MRDVQTDREMVFAWCLCELKFMCKEHIRSPPSEQPWRRAAFACAAKHGGLGTVRALVKFELFGCDQVNHFNTALRVTTQAHRTARGELKARAEGYLMIHRPHLVQRRITAHRNEGGIEGNPATREHQFTDSTSHLDLI